MKVCAECDGWLIIVSHTNIVEDLSTQSEFRLFCAGALYSWQMADLPRLRWNVWRWWNVLARCPRPQPNTPSTPPHTTTLRNLATVYHSKKTNSRINPWQSLVPPPSRQPSVQHLLSSAWATWDKRFVTLVSQWGIWPHNIVRQTGTTQRNALQGHPQTQHRNNTSKKTFAMD